MIYLVDWSRRGCDHGAFRLVLSITFFLWIYRLTGLVQSSPSPGRAPGMLLCQHPFSQPVSLRAKVSSDHPGGSKLLTGDLVTSKRYRQHDSHASRDLFLKSLSVDHCTSRARINRS